MRQKTVGELLADERKRLNLSLAAVSEQTHIQLDQLIALEENNFTALPPSPFVKAFIRSYATVCGVEAEPFISLLRRDYKESAKGTLVPREFLSPLVERKGRLKPIRVVGVVIAGIFVALIGYSAAQLYQLQQPPQLTIRTPEELAQTSSVVSIEGVTDPDALVTVNAAPVALRVDGSFVTELEFATTGINQIVVEAKDRRGKVRRLERHVVVSF